MANGYWEKMIEVDMTKGTVEVTDRHMQYVQEYIGGRPLGIKMLWEALKDNPGVDPMGPDNVLFLIPGIVAGNPITGSSRWVAYTKSGITQAINSPYGEFGATVGYATGGGKFSPALKQAGFDLVCVKGKSTSGMKILHVNNGTVELIDGSKYAGMRTGDFEEAIQREYGPEYKFAAVGPAAENGCRMSCIMCESGRAAGRGGCGAVMAAKGLKAVIVKGEMVPPVANPAALEEKFFEIHNRVWSNAGTTARRAYGTTSILTTNSNKGIESVKNHREGTNPYDEQIGCVACQNNFWVRHRACYACPQTCMKWGVANEGPHKGAIAEGPEYEAAQVGANWLIKDMGEYAAIMEYLEGAGFDLIGIGGTVAFALECYEKGVITSKDIDGIKLEWSNGDACIEFMKRLVEDHKNPIYDWFRRGNQYTARKLDAERGSQSIRWAMDVKNHTYAAHQATNQPARMMCYGTSSRGACHVHGNTAAAQNSNMIKDMGVFCSFSGGALGTSGQVEVINFVHGSNLTADQFLYIGEKAYQLEKMFNLLNGFTPEDDIPAWRNFNEPHTYGAGEGICQDWDTFMETRKNDYYLARGWDGETSIPTEGKLIEMGLNDVVPYLAKIPKQK